MILNKSLNHLRHIRKMKNKIENKRTSLDKIQTDNHSITFVILDQKKLIC